MLLYKQGTRYLSTHTKALEKYNLRVQHQQAHLLRKLAKKDQKLKADLKNTDSFGYANYSKIQPDYDSISRLMHPDSLTLSRSFSRKANKNVDSLKAIQSFVQAKTSGLPNNLSANTTLPKPENLTQLNNQLNYNEYINKLISQRANNLKKVSVGNDFTQLAGIDKEIAFATSKMEVWKQVAENPSSAEEKALEYLQGTEGFDQYLSKASLGNGISTHNATSAEELERMGFQTKGQLNKLLKQKFGGNLGAVQEQMSSHVADWKEATTDVTSKTNELKASIAAGKQAPSQIKKQLKASKGNPMKGIPFWQRFEKQYGFQTTRPTTDGGPALLQLSAGVGYRQTELLMLGIALASNVGLGQSWNSVRLSLEGIGARTFITYETFYGISLYAGYERMFKQVSLNTQNNNESINSSSPHNTNSYSEAALLGLSKTYKINAKYNGAFQVLYDVWWKEKGLRTPIIIRTSTLKK